MKPPHTPAAYLAALCLTVSLPSQAGFWDNVKEQADKARSAIESLDNAASQASKANKHLDRESSNAEQENKQQRAQTPPQEHTRKAASSNVSQPVTRSPQYDQTQVLEIQKRLTALGYDVGKPDGIYGSGTRRGIEEFQRDKGLPVDGRPSAALSSRLSKVAQTAELKSAPQSRATEAGSATIAHLSDTKETKVNSATSGTGPEKPSRSSLPQADSVDMLLTVARLRPDLLDTQTIGGEKRDLLAHFVRTYPQWFGLDQTQAYSLLENEFEYPRRREEFKKIVQTRVSDAPLRFSKKEDVAFADYDFKNSFYPFRQPLKLAPGVAADYIYLNIPGELKLQGLSIPPTTAERIHNRQNSNHGAIAAEMRNEGRVPAAGDLAGGGGIEITWTYAIKDVKYSTETEKPKIRTGFWLLQIVPENLTASELWMEFTGKKGKYRYETVQRNESFLTLNLNNMLREKQVALAKAKAQQRATPPDFQAPQGVTLLDGESLRSALVDKTLLGGAWLVHLQGDGTFDGHWIPVGNQGTLSYSGQWELKGPVLCVKYNTQNKELISHFRAARDTTCMTMSQADTGRLELYDLRGRNLEHVPTRGPFTNGAQPVSGRQLDRFDQNYVANINHHDILGVRRGESLDNAVSVIKRQLEAPRVEWVDASDSFNDPNDQWVRIVANDNSDIVILGASGGKVTVVYRGVNYPRGEGPLVEVVDGAIKRKYPDAHSRSENKNKIRSVWLDRGAGPVTRQDDAGQCWFGFNRGISRLTNTSEDFAEEYGKRQMGGIFSRLKDNCGETLHVELMGAEEKTLGMMFVMYNQAELAKLHATKMAQLKNNQMSSGIPEL